MSYPTDRVVLFDRNMDPLPELNPAEVFSRVRTEEINGEHSLTITTTRRLEEGWRALTVDGTGKWREWVVTEPDEDHSSGKHAIGTYHLVWSLQYDLTRSYVHTHSEIGYGSSPKSSQEVAAVVLSGVPYWSVGQCDAAPVESGKGEVFIYESAWSKLSKAVECMGCEVDAEIEVSSLYGVTARKLMLKAHVGNEDAVRRFDWGHDLTEIKRTPDPGPYYCRVVPLGRGQTEYADDNETTFDWPIDITEETGTEENPGPYWIQDDEAALVFRFQDSEGNWVYPTKAVSYSEDDPELLFNAAMDDLHNHTRPGVTYEASVVQLAQAGMSVYGIALGDDVQCVDRGFNPDAALRIQGRVVQIEVDELSPETGTQLTIGQLRNDFTSSVALFGESLDELQEKHSQVAQSIASMSTARYIDELLDRINAEINATGGYAYFVPGEGIITYDIAVDDPITGTRTDGAVPTKVTQIKGGSIRIADQKESSAGTIDDWNWRTVFTADGINADLVTTVKIISGYIGNAANSSYWNIDTGELVLRMPYSFSGPDNTRASSPYLLTHNGYVQTADSQFLWDVTGGMGIVSGDAYIPGFKVSAWRKSTTAGVDDTEKSYIMLIPFGTDWNQNGSYTWNSLVSKHSLYIMAAKEDPSGSSSILMVPNRIILKPDGVVGYTGSSTATFTVPAGVDVQTGRITLDVADKFELNSIQLLLNANGISIGDNAALRKNVTISGTGSTKIGTALTISNGTGDYPRIGSHLCVGSEGDTSVDGYPGNGSVLCTTIKAGNYQSNNGYVLIYGNFYLYGGTLSCSGTVSNSIKSRLVETEDYGNKLLFCYETPAPMFGDLGSGTIGDDGYAYVSIDDVFSETARTDAAYQVFLQKCGQGDLWVAEKHPSYFVVQGTPNLPFDWEIKAHQVDFENTRLEDFDRYKEQEDASSESFGLVDETSKEYDDSLDEAEQIAEETESVYDDYVSEIEQLYDEELAA